MCIRTRKPLLVCGGPMMAFYYLCSTDMERAIDVINKNPKKRIKDFLHIKPNDKYDMLIDPVTGDLYEYDYTLDKWQPKINAGLHYKAVNETDPILKHMNQRPVFNVKPVDEDYPLIKAVNVEAIIRLDDVDKFLLRIIGIISFSRIFLPLFWASIRLVGFCILCP